MKKHETFLKRMLNKVNIQNKDLTIAGSYRRNKKESGDIDVLLCSSDKNIYNLFISSLKEFGYLIDDLALGTKKYNGVCKLGNKGTPRRIDIMYTKPEEYPFAILYFTGSGNFNTNMRDIILKKGMSINEYNLKDNITKNKIIHPFITEKDIFDFLELDYVEPHQRL